MVHKPADERIKRIALIDVFNAMNLHLAYGKNGLDIDLPENRQITLVEPAFSPPIPNPCQALKDALRHPFGSLSLHNLVKPKDKVGIIFNDITRPTPSSQIFHAILQELYHVPCENVTLFNALGTHRPNTPEELRIMLDNELVHWLQVKHFNKKSRSFR